MSTKITIGYSDNYHLAKDCLNEDSFYLTLNNLEFKTSCIKSICGDTKNTITVEISRNMLESIVTSYLAKERNVGKIVIEKECSSWDVTPNGEQKN